MLKLWELLENAAETLDFEDFTFDSEGRLFGVRPWSDKLEVIGSWSDLANLIENKS